MMNRVLIIAEAGVNHNGDLGLAFRLVDEAKNAGADVVKFQTFNPQMMVTNSAEKAEYQKMTTAKEESQQSMLRRLALTEGNFVELCNYCKGRGISFCSTPFDFESIDFLNGLEMPFWKIPSGEITNYPYLVKIARTGKPVIMSTGMCEMGEILEAVSVLRENGAGAIKLLHCNTQYPTPYEDVNLKAIDTMHKTTGLDIGYSDHTKGIEVPIAAAAMGAAVIEKHFTLDKNMPGPDHKASLEPAELKAMVEAIRNIEKAMGDGVKQVTESEKNNLTVARKSIVALKAIKKGDIFTEENITTKRPGTGISPMKWRDVLGKTADRDYREDDLIKL